MSKREVGSAAVVGRPPPHPQTPRRSALRQTPNEGLSVSDPLLLATNIYKAYRKDALEVPVLKGLDLEVQAGEFLCLLGASGSGKSTLLHLLGTLDRPDQGEIR